MGRTHFRARGGGGDDVVGEVEVGREARSSLEEVLGDALGLNVLSDATEIAPAEASTCSAGASHQNLGTGRQQKGELEGFLESQVSVSLGWCRPHSHAFRWEQPLHSASAIQPSSSDFHSA